VSIGIQIIKSPSLLFLDEPTSGLDSHMAGKLVSALRDLANEGRTIVATIHQPSAAVFECFDRVLLLAVGRVVFNGSRTAAEHFFQDIGRPLPNRWNPADWYITCIDTIRERELVLEPGVLNNKRASYSMPYSKNKPRGGVEPPASGTSRRTTHEQAPVDVADLRDAVERFYNKHNPAKLKSNPEVVDEITQYALRKGIQVLNEKLAKAYGGAGLVLASQIRMEPATQLELDTMIQKYSTSKFAAEDSAQIRRVREAVTADIARSSLGRNPQGLAFMRQMGLADDNGDEADDDEDGVPIVTQVLLLSRRAATLAWRDPSNITFQASQNFVFGILLGILYSGVSLTVNHALILSNAMAIILAMTGFVATALGSATAFADRLVFDREQSDNLYAPVSHYLSRLLVCVPVDSFIALMLIIPAYFIIGLKPDGVSFLFFCLVNLSVIFIMDSIIYIAALLSPNVDVAFAIGNLHQALAILFCGVFIPVYSMPKVFAWIYFVSPFSYAYGAVAINQFANTPDSWWIASAGVVVADQWVNLLIVFLMGAWWRAVGFFVMTYLYRKKLGMRPGEESVTNNSNMGMMNVSPMSSAMTMSPMSSAGKGGLEV